MTSASRHNHFPRRDAPRRARMRAAADAAEARWHAEDRAAGGLSAALDVAATLPPPAAVASLGRWLGDIGWLEARLADALALLAADPFARPPLRPIGGGEGAGGLLLAQRGAARVSLQVDRGEGRCAPPSTAVFVPGAAAVRVLAAGGASVRRHRVALSADERAGAFRTATAAACHSSAPRPLVPGEIWTLDTGAEAFTLAGGSGDVLLLEIAVQPAAPLPTRTYDIASGRLVRASASRRDSSVRQMALALLRSFGRTDAAPLFAAETQAQDFAARWAAMREFVALDPAAAHPHLARMAAADPHPEIRRAAAATLALYAPLPLAGGVGGGPVEAPAPETCKCPA